MPDEGSERSQRWSGRPVLVTGAGGFIGSHLAEALARAGAEVRAFVRYNSRGDHGWLEVADPDVSQEIEVFRGDLGNPEAVAGGDGRARGRLPPGRPDSDSRTPTGTHASS